MAKRNLSQMKAEVGQMIGTTSDAFLNTSIENSLNSHYMEVRNSFLWPGTFMRGSVATVIDQDFIVFDYPVRDILIIHQRETDDYIKSYADPYEFIRQHYDDDNAGGVARESVDDGRYAAKAAPTADATLDIASDSTADNTQTLRLYGKDSSGNFVTEQITLDGTTTVISATTWESVDFQMFFDASLSAVTAGTVTINSNDPGATEVMKIRPGDITTKYLWRRLWRVPDSVFNMFFVATKQFRRLVNDEDVTDCDIDEAIMNMTAGDVLDSLERDGSTKRGMGEQKLQSYRDEIMGKSDRVVSIVPENRDRDNIA